MPAGQGLRGSTDLHAFGDSNLYLRRVGGRLVLSMEHRAAAPPDPVGLELVTADEQTIHLEVAPQPSSRTEPRHAPDLAQAVLAALEGRPGMTRQALRRELAVQNHRLGRTLLALQRQGQVQRGENGWRLTGLCTVPCSRP
jgi:hypothetical protein